MRRIMQANDTQKRGGETSTKHHVLQLEFRIQHA